MQNQSENEAKETRRLIKEKNDGIHVWSNDI